MAQPAMSQRTIYKLIDALLSSQFNEPLEMLQALVRYLVDSEHLIMTGGRVWQLNSDSDAYTLRFQYGELADLKEGTKRPFSEMPGTLELASHASIETEPRLIEGKGERAFSLSCCALFSNSNFLSIGVSAHLSP